MSNPFTRLNISFIFPLFLFVILIVAMEIFSGGLLQELVPEYFKGNFSKLCNNRSRKEEQKETSWWKGE